MAGMVVIIAIISAVLFAFAYPCIVGLVREIDKELALEEATSEGSAEEEEEYSFWYNFVFDDILFDFVLLRFLKRFVERVKNSEKVDFSPKWQAVLAVWGVAVFLAVRFCFGLSWYSLFAGIFIWILTIITVVDFMRMEIPSELNGLIYIMGVLSFFLFPEISLTSRLIGMLIISVPMQLIVFAVPGGFGGGDIKLMFVAGLFMGMKGIIAGFFIGLVLGGAYGVLQLAMRKLGRKEHFAFGPFLSAGMIVALFYGNALINWYLSAFLGR